MLLVILGAGASYDSLSTLPVAVSSLDRPPLAAHLFDDRPLFRAVEAKYRHASPLFPVLRVAGIAGTIEAALDQLHVESAEDSMRLVQLAALRYYIRDVVATVTNQWVADNRDTQLNHHALLEQIAFGKPAHERVLLVTFNYDMYLERAVSQARDRRYVGLRDWVIGTDFPIFKLHGSVNWSRSVSIKDGWSQSDFPGGRFNAAGLIKYGARWREDSTYHLETNEALPLVPAIAVPLHSKTEFMCPDEHLNALRIDLPKVDRVLAIGWRGQEGHFLQLLSETVKGPVRVWAVSGKQADSANTLSQLQRSELRILEANPLDMGFSDVVSRRAAAELFRSR